VYLHRIGRTGRAGRAGVAITLAEPREHRHLKIIERVTKSKFEIATVPTVADLRSRQLDLTQAALRERLLAGKSEHMRVVIDSLSQEFDIVDIATAAVHMAHVSLAGEGNDREIPAIDMNKRQERPMPPEGQARPVRAARGESGRPGERGALKPRPQRRIETDGRIVRIFVGAGRQAGVRPGDLVGAITGEAGIDSRSLGAIEIGDRFSLVEVPESMADEIIEAMQASTIRGRKVQFRRERF
jgi:ATP-dependent RNA helicase DeaD